MTPEEAQRFMFAPETQLREWKTDQDGQAVACTLERRGELLTVTLKEGEIWTDWREEVRAAANTNNQGNLAQAILKHVEDLAGYLRKLGMNQASACVLGAGALVEQRMGVPPLEILQEAEQLVAVAQEFNANLWRRVSLEDRKAMGVEPEAGT